MNDNEKHLKAAADLIKAFEKENEPERLREASMQLEDVNLRVEYVANKRKKVRAECLMFWLVILRTIDRNMDESFDPEKVPEMSVMPPKTKAGVQYPPGADPALIDDPQAREEYEKAVKENRANQEKYLLQTEFRELNEHIPGKVDSFVRSAFAHSEEDRNEVRTAIDRIIESESRKDLLNRAVQSLSEE